MTKTDPLVQIRLLDPIDHTELGEYATSRVGLAVRDRILIADPLLSEPHRRPLWRRRPFRVAIGAAAAVASVAAAAILTGAPTINPLSVGCYQTASQEADTAIVTLDPGQEAAGPVGACATVWPSAFGEPVPENLVACVVPGGGLGVFPTAAGLAPADACNAIGTQPAIDGDYAGLTGTDVRALDAQLRAQYEDILNRQGCVGSTQLATDLQAIAGDFGATQWTVVDRSIRSDTWTTPEGNVQRVTAPTAPDGSACASFVIDATKGQIVIITEW